VTFPPQIPQLKGSPPKRALKASLLLSFAALTLGACQAEEPQTGSQTNWLKSCTKSEDCGDLSCVCGTCTLTCDSEEACGDLGSSECVQVGDVGAVALCNGLTPEAPLCLQHCEPGSCPDGSHCVAGVCGPVREGGVLVSINPDRTAQELVGIGASMLYDDDAIIAHPLKSELYDVMFRDSGLDIFRFRARFNGDNPEVLVAAGEIVAEAEARMERPPLVLLTSSSPAPNLKQNGVRFCPQTDPTCTLTRNAEGGFDYAGYAEYWRSTLEAYEGAGVIPQFLSMQNNPDWLPGIPDGGEACRFLPEEGTETITLTDGSTVEAEFPSYMTALEAVRLAIQPLGRDYTFVAPEAGNLAALADYYDVLREGGFEMIAYHLFGNYPPNLPFDALEELETFSREAGAPHIQTEMGANGIDTAILLHHTLVTAGGAGYIQNQLMSQAIDPGGGSPIGSDGVTFEIQPAYHALAHFARDTDPGWLLAEAESGSEDVLASAWVSPDAARLTIVLVNQGERYTDVEVDAPTEWRAALESAVVTRTVFTGVERSVALGTLPPNRVLRIPGRTAVTIAARME
jgi:glucuronoarabinoxylan endo-1,4-beta-xylanase